MPVPIFVTFLQFAFVARSVVNAAFTQSTPIVQNLNLVISSLIYPILNKSTYALDPISYRNLAQDPMVSPFHPILARWYIFSASAILP